MKGTARMIVAGARYSEASGDFPASWFSTVIDDEGNVFENVYAKESVFQEPPPPASPMDIDFVLSKNRDGKLRLQIAAARPAKT